MSAYAACRRQSRRLASGPAWTLPEAPGGHGQRPGGARVRVAEREDRHQQRRRQADLSSVWRVGIVRVQPELRANQGGTIGGARTRAPGRSQVKDEQGRCPQGRGDAQRSSVHENGDRGTLRSDAGDSKHARLVIGWPPGLVGSNPAVVTIWNRPQHFCLAQLV